MRAASLLISHPVRRLAARNVAAAVAWVVASACAKPVVVYRSPAEALAAEYGRALRLQTVTGERYTIYQGRVHSDTLYAIRGATPAGADSTVTIPLSDVSSLTRVERGLSASSAGAIGFTTGALAGVLVLLGLLIGLSG